MSPAGASPGDDRRVRDLRVVLLLAICVVVVLGLNVISGLVPEVDDLLSGAPVLVLVLVGGTLGVLLISVGRRRPD